MAFVRRRLSLAVFFLHCLRFISCARNRNAPPDYRFMQEATRALPLSHYDYIIVGGGTAGCPLAATLSRKFRVLLLERGGSPYGNANITEMANFSRTLSDASPGSPAQRFVSEDGVVNARARVLGGGSSLNAGFYTRASAEYVRAAGWDAALANRSYRWVERTVTFEPPVFQWQSALRDGLLEAGVTPFNGFTFDHVHGTKVGGTIFDRDGRRHTAADLLLHANPDKLTVILHATAAKILFGRRGNGEAFAHGVLFSDVAGGEHEAYLYQGSRSEIILCAGAVGSPQLLMLSGVGPREQLESLGIDVVVEQPLVGQGMSDNPMNAIFVPSPAPVEVSLIQVVGITALGSFIEGASGANFAPPYSAARELRFGVFSQQTDVAGEGSSIMSFVQKTNDDGEPTLSMRGGFILEKIVGPLSTGSLVLKDKNPGGNPTVTFNYFKEPDDLTRCVKGMEMIEKVILSKAFSKFRYSFISMEDLINMTLDFPVNLLPKHENAAKSLEQFCRDTVMTIWHYHGGCRVGEVVDEDYRVSGVDALRVIDGSTFTSSPGTNPQATVMMLGRYMGLKILRDRFRSQEAQGRS